jgi:hypothetical protein
MGVKKAYKPSSAIKKNSDKSVIEKLSTNQKYGIGAMVGLLAIYVGYLLTSTIHYLNPTDARLKEVFFGNEPWIVLCDDGSAVDSVFESVSRKETGVKFGVLDCAAQLPSKKTTFQRLKLNEAASKPAMFFSGYGRDPKQLPAKLLRNQYVFRKEITALTRLPAVKIKDTTKLYKKCLKNGQCALVLAGGEMDAEAVRAVNKGAEARPEFSWVILDSNQYKLRKPSEKDIGMKKFQGSGQHRLLLLGNNDGSDGATLSASPFLGSFEEDAVADFVRKFNESDTSLKQIDPEALAIMKRKLQQQYRAPTASPTVNEEATILPTAQQEERRQLAAARRAERELAKRQAMDAEAEDFIEYEGDEDDDEDDEDDDDEDDYDSDDEDEEDEEIID